MAYATVAELAAELRVAVTAGNTARLQACLDAAQLEIDHSVDRAADQVAPTGEWELSNIVPAADPGPGQLRLDKPTTPPATKVYIDMVDFVGVNRSAGLAGLIIDDLVQVEDAAGGPNYVLFGLTGPAV